MASRPRRLPNIQSMIGCIPMIAVSVGVFVICIAYSITLSFTNSRLFPKFDFVGLMQYERLWDTPRWIVSVQNIWLYGVLVIGFNMIFGYLLAAFMDQRIKQEDLLRTIFLYPFALSLIVTGLVWQWMLDPNLGIEAAMQNWGFAGFEFAPISDPATAIYGVIIAGVWQGTGVTMAILLAGLRGVDAEIWKAARVDGIPNWRTYIFIVLPMIKGALATAFVLQAVSVVRVYDLIVAMTQGGPGIATQMPAVFVIEHITNRQNAGIGMAAATMMLLPIMALVGLRGYFQWRSSRAARRAQAAMEART
ncbi:sugar ABC transporter permease [Nitratireductor mangrovi]|uniref:Sugar ABC transporter permease n=1 Tax=Nitratireductor mangrovi TaxID=2599600 RepID=A0A5B8KV87_9HYPH|nr:sugar ABC transporter permease [Nitratireductor mangrovi]QDY99478.1 sugar ABC transporter permease [Nitratireductor mangrovi]